MKKIITALMLVLVATRVSAQGIVFLPEGATFQQAIEFAQKDGRKIFLDCYTSWCGPCKMMARDVFPQAEVGDFMNPLFVSIKIDMEKGEGPELMQRFGVDAFPTFIIFDSNGMEIGRWRGASDVEGFIRKVKDVALNSKLHTMAKRFAEGDRELQFLTEYLDVLAANHKMTEASEVAEVLLDGKAETFASDEYLRKVFISYLRNPFHSAFIYTAKNPKALSDVVGKDVVESKLRSVWLNYPRMGVMEEVDGKVVMNEERWQTYLQLMEECNAYDRERIRLTTLLTYHERRMEWQQYVECLKELYGNENLDVNDLDLCKYCKPVAEGCNDAELRGDVKVILQDRLAKLRSGEREPLRKVGNMTLSGSLDKAMEMLIEKL